MHGPVLLLLIRNAGEGRDPVARMEAMQKCGGELVPMRQRRRVNEPPSSWSFWVTGVTRLRCKSDCTGSVNAGRREPSHKPNAYR
jgi:hypothetical protein